MRKSIEEKRTIRLNEADKHVLYSYSKKIEEQYMLKTRLEVQKKTGSDK